MTSAFLAAATMTALAELGDKSGLLALVLATRYGAARVLAGVLAAILAVTAISTFAGELAGRLLPATAVRIGSGILFLAVGVWLLASRSGDEEEEAVSRRGGAVLASAAAFFLAEFGDKTQLATLSLAARYATEPGLSRRSAFLAVWLGSSAGMFVVNAAGIALGAALGPRLPRRLLTRLSALAFIGFGLFALSR